MENNAERLIRFYPLTELKINITITALLLSCYIFTFPVSQAPRANLYSTIFRRLLPN